MTKQEFIDYLGNMHATYVDESTDDYECVIVYGNATNIITFTGEKRIYVPYLRVSHFGERESELYVRDNGYCDWYSIERIHEICHELTYGIKIDRDK